MRSLVFLLGSCALVACGGGAGSTGPTTAKPEASGQVATGATVYEKSCASCHGSKGEGKGDAPALIGKKALDDYKTAKDVFDYAKANMPPKSPGSLSDDEYWAVTAWVLDQNGISSGKTLSSSNAADVKLAR